MRNYEEPYYPAFASESDQGMSKRFYAACCAMQGLLANPSVAVNTAPYGDIISDAYKYADELLKQE